MRSSNLRSAIAVSLLLVAALAVPALATDHGEHPTRVRFERVDKRLVAVELSELATFVLPDGTTFVGDEGEEGDEEEGEPPVGSVFYLSEDLFLPADDDPDEPAGDPIGRTQIACEFLPRSDLRCTVDVRVFDKGELHHTTLLNFEEDFGEEGEFFVEAAITGGSGAFAGATGQTAVTEREDFEESGVTFYDVQAILPVHD